MDNVEKLSELSNCADSVHTHPVNAYQHFVNAFVYINNSYGRQDAVRKAQEVWKVGSDEKKDQHLKDVMTDRCPRCRYVFTSQADQHRHIQLVHGGNRVLNEISGSEPVPKKSTYRCVVCSQEYHSKYQLQKHKNESGHTVGRGRPKKTNPASTCTQQPG